MKIENDNFKSIIIFSLIFFLLGYIIGGNTSDNKTKGIFISDEITSLNSDKDFMIHLDSDDKIEGSAHVIMKKLKLENGEVEIEVDTDVDKILEKYSNDGSTFIKIDSTTVDGKKEIRVEVRKEKK
ncbi:MAG: hypothetical protein VW741_04440 [Flammeovirgaceae bacterium]